MTQPSGGGGIPRAVGRGPSVARLPPTLRCCVPPATVLSLFGWHGEAGSGDVKGALLLLTKETRLLSSDPPSFALCEGGSEEGKLS